MRRPDKYVLSSIIVLLVGLLTAEYSSAQCVIPPTDLVAWWPGDGNTLDIASGFDGDSVGDSGFAEGIVAEAFILDGEGDYISVPHHPALQPAEITVGAWIRGSLSSQAGTLSVMVDKSHGFLDQTGWALQTNQSGQATFTYGNGFGFPEVFSTTNVLDDGWHLVTGTLGNGIISLYVDGFLENEMIYWGTPAGNERAVNIGASFGGHSGFARFFAGLIDEIDIFDRALTPDEIHSLHEAGMYGKCKEPVFLPITMDIKPGDDASSVNCNNDNGIITVAILTTSIADGEGFDFDAEAIDQETVSFQGAGETHLDKRSGEPRRHVEDIDRDGDLDLILHFRMGATDLACDSSQGTLLGETFDGTPVAGTDGIRMVGGTKVITVGGSQR